MKPIVLYHSVTTQVRMQGSDADGLIRISMGDNGPIVQSRPRNPASVAVAAAGVLQLLSISNLQQSTVLFSKLFEFELYSAEY